MNKAEEVQARMMPRPAWIVVVTKSHMEPLARMHLEAQHYQVYLPMRLGHPKAKKPVQPFFPRYMFVQLMPDQGWWPIVSTVGVHDVLRAAADQPYEARERMIRAMMAREVEGMIQINPPAVSALRSGDAVRISEGPMTGFEGVFQEVVDSRRVAILVSVLGRDSRVVLHGRALSGAVVR